MKKYYGNYLGICINNNDPQKRGRVQVFVPHIMPAMYDHWNKQEIPTDIYVNCVGDNIINGLTSAQILKLSQILPWAESASPIVGTSSPGNLVQQAAEFAAGMIGTAVGGAPGAAIAKGIVGSVFNQSPVGEPVEVESMTDLFTKAADFNTRGVGLSQFQRTGSPDGLCGVGARSIVGAMTSSNYFKQGLGEKRNSYASSLSEGNNYLQKSGLYQNAVSMPSNYINDPSQWKVGDVITAGGGGGDGKGHIQVWTGKAWVSDHSQNRIYTENSRASYSNFVLHRPNASGEERIKQTMPKLIADTTPTSGENTSVSGEVAAASPHQSAAPVEQNLESNQYGNIANPNVELNLQTTTEQVGLSSSGLYSDNFFEFIKSREGYNENAYWDYGQYSIGYGTKATSSTEKITREQADARLKTELNKAATETNELLSKRGISLTQSQTEALMSFTYNGGKGMTQKLLDGGEGGRKDWASISEGMKLYNKAGGKTLDGLTNRRNAEIDFANTNGAGSFTASQTTVSGTTSTNLVNNVDRHGTTVTQNLNNMAKGLFTYPAAGAMLWVFFREGNPLYPVYFAASYSQEEWKSAYRYGSDGPGYRPASTPDNPVTSTGGIMNLNGVGGIRWEDTNDPTNRINDQKSIMFFGEDGSNMFMGKGYHQIFSKFDRRDQVEGDRWETSLGYKEEWVQGDKNVVVMGDLYVKVGNVSQPAVDAVERIQQLIKEIQAPLAGKSEGEGSSSETGSNKTEHMTEKQKAVRKQLDKFNQQALDKYSMSPSDFYAKHGLNAYFPSEPPPTFQTMKSNTNAGTATTGLNAPSTVKVQLGSGQLSSPSVSQPWRPSGSSGSGLSF